MTIVPILVYHRIGTPPSGHAHPDTYVSASAFDRQIGLLRALGYRSADAADYRRAARGLHLEGAGKRILITFDDGSATVLSHALPVLERHGFSAALFMVASAFGEPARWDGEDGSCGHRQLDAAQLKELARRGWTIGAHTRTHPRLDGLDDARLDDEVAGSKAALETVLGAEVKWFAYPYGAFDARSREAVRRAGYEAGFATEKGDADPLSVPRRVISGRNRIWKFFWRLRQARALSRR